MEFESPLSQFKVLKKAIAYFELKVRNAQIKEQPSSRRDPQEISVGVRTPFAEIFWMKISSRRTKDKQRSKVFVKGRPGTWYMFIVAIVFLMSGPFFYMAIDSNSIITYLFAGFCILLGILGIIMPFVRLALLNKKLKEVLTSEDDSLFQEIEAKEVAPISTRIEI